MQIDKVTVAIRPRETWEAVDLGFRMAQHWRKAIYAPWIIVCLCVAAALFYLGRELEMLWLYVLLFWWLKPLYSRIPLYVLSHTVFGHEPAMGETLRAVPRIFKTSPLWRLLLFRFSFMRCFDMPVVMLEGLKGRERRERMQVLRRNTAGNVAWLTMIMFLIQVLLYFTFLLIILLFIPEDVNINGWHIVFPFTEDTPLIWRFVGMAVFTAVIVLTEPFYIAAGFALYLNRRTLLEGWDIEIAFHRMLERLRQSGAITHTLLLPVFAGILVLTCAIQTSPALAIAAPTVPQAKQTIEEIMQTEEFNTKEQHEFYRYKNEQEEKKKQPGKEPGWLKMFGSLGQYLAVMFKVVLVILLGMLIAWLAIHHERWLNWIRGIKPAPKFVPPKQLFGLDIRPESLPDNIAQEALTLWRQGKLRAALSLLYRGALSRLATQEGITLKESYTEGDCLREVSRQVDQAKGKYFSRLTTAWQMVAYANRSPDVAEGELLCQQYPAHFEARP